MMNTPTEEAGELHPISLEAGKLKDGFGQLQAFYASIYPDLQNNLFRKSVAVWLCIFAFLLPSLGLIVFLIRYPEFTSTTEYSALLVVLAFASPLWCAGIIMLYDFLMRLIRKANKIPQAGPEFMKRLDSFSEQYFGYPQSGFYDSLVYNGNKETGQAEKILGSLWLPIRSVSLYSKNSAAGEKSVQLLFLGSVIELWEGPFPDPELSSKKEHHHLPKI
jgi:hypothetical protein